MDKPSRFVAGTGIANCDIFFLGLKRLPCEGEEVFSQGFDIQPGGGVVGTLTLLSRLNVPVKLVTFLGRDEFSLRIKRALDDSGVTYKNLYKGDDCPVIISSTMITKSNRSFVSYRGKVCDDQETESMSAKFLEGAAIMELQPETLGVCKLAKSTNPDIIMVMDTGWDDDMSIDNYREYIALADYYTPNRAEAMKMTSTGSPVEALFALSKYFANPIVKLDSEGCLVMENGRAVLVPALRGVTHIDATGAGDAFLSGFMYGLYNFSSIVDCVRFGNVTGGTCVQAVGCLTKYVNETELLKMSQTIEPRFID